MRTREWWIELCGAIDAKDSGKFVSYLTEDCEFRFGNGPSVTGRAAIGAAVDGFWASIRASRHEVREVWSNADSAVCEGTCTYTRHDGSVVTIPFVDVLRFRGVEAHQYLIYMDAAPLWERG